MPTIGETLKESREKQKLSIDVAAKAVKVKNDVLEEIERDDFSHFAAPLYARGILRLYASFLGLEPETLVEEFNKVHPASKPKSSDQYAPGEREQIMARRSAVVISTVSKPSDLSSRGVVGVVVVVVVLGLLIWRLSSSSAPKPEVVEPTIAPRITEIPRPAPAPTEAVSVPSFSSGNEAAPPATNNPSVAPISIPALEVQPEGQ
jgi:cytoskeleton protein RodZ